MLMKILAFTKDDNFLIKAKVSRLIAAYRNNRDSALWNEGIEELLSMGANSQIKELIIKEENLC